MIDWLVMEYVHPAMIGRTKKVITVFCSQARSIFSIFYSAYGRSAWGRMLEEPTQLASKLGNEWFPISWWAPLPGQERSWNFPVITYPVGWVRKMLDAGFFWLRLPDEAAIKPKELSVILWKSSCRPRPLCKQLITSHNISQPSFFFYFSPWD